MAHISRMTDLSMFIPRGGYETTVAQSDETVMYAANAEANNINGWGAYSLDGGLTFTGIDAESMTTDIGERLCCDQVIIYVPRIQRFVWVLQTEQNQQGENSILIAVAPKSSIASSKGTAWVRYRLTAAANFNRSGGFWLDHSRLSYGDNYLYFTCLLVGPMGVVGSVIARFDLDQLVGMLPLNPFDKDRSLRGDFAVVQQRFVAPLRGTGNRGYFAAIGPDWSSIMVFVWEEGAGKRPWAAQVPTESIPTEDYSSLTPPPAQRDWIGDTTGETIKWSVRVMSGVRRRDELWVAWNGARRVPGQSVNEFPHPHIGIAVIDANQMVLQDTRYIWHTDYAYTYPTLDVNARGDVAMTYCSGGGARHVQHGVGFVSDPIDLRKTTNHTSSYGGGGHYMGIQPVFPDEICFVAAGHIGVIRQPNNGPPRKTLEPYFVRFSRDGVSCGFEGDIFSRLQTGLRRLIVGILETAETTLYRRG
jgi:hypothetical protein